MKNKNKIIRRSIQILSVLLFIGCISFLIYYLGIQPYISKQVNDKYRNIYYSASEETASEIPSDNFHSVEEEVTEDYLKLDTSKKGGAKDANGILLKFSKLLEYNSDIRGWLSISGTGIDYPVMQAYNGSDFYLSHDFEGTKDKNGCLYIDGHSSVKKPSKNIVIHGHNMETTKMMFYELPNYKNIDFYREHPVITFDSLYRESQWKIISFMRVSGANADNGTFNYMQSDFEDDEDFLDFLYQIQIRSLYKCPVDVNENDHILMLSTCSYEIDNCRSVVVARRVRKNESADVDTSTAYMRNNVLYPRKWYSQYGGEPPITTSFKEAMSFSEIDWYDGDTKVESSIGKIIEQEDFQYKITSKTTVKYMGSSKKKLTELTIPSTIKIEGRTYDVTEISTEAFRGMTKLQEIRIGNNITEIKQKLFIDCKKLESVIIGESVTKIGKKAFYNLENLRKITIKSTVLDSVISKAFYGIAPKARFRLPEAKYKKYHKLIEDSNVSEKTKYIKY